MALFSGDQSLVKYLLLLTDDTDNLKEHLVDELDYVLLPTNAWNKVLEWYGIQEGQVTNYASSKQCSHFVRKQFYDPRWLNRLHIMIK